MAHAPARSQPGDAIFVYSRGKDGFLNVEFQKSIFDKGRTAGPWFSHVAIALDDQIAFEASTPPAEDDRPTWSRSELKGGVRFIAVADLLLDSKSWQVLRSSQASALAKDAFSIAQPYISGVYGNQYSIDVFQEYAREVAPLRSAVADLVGVSEGWTSEPAGVGNRIREDFRQRVLKDFPNHKFTFEERTYYCSDLVRVLLSEVGLLPKQKRDARVTPSAFYDQLNREPGWTDVTNASFSPESVEAFRAERQDSIKTVYDNVLIEAGTWRDKHGFRELWSVVEKQLGHANDTLDNMVDRLTRRPAPAPPSGQEP